MRPRLEYGEGLMTMRLRVPDGLSSAEEARHQVASALEAHGYEGDVSIILLLVSEMVTNAVLHALPPVDLVLDVDGASVTVTVGDGDADHVPEMSREPIGDPERVTGRGLQIVDQLADAWGYDKYADGGKSVWFTIGSVGS
jgi:anti-sigma regulatory factor (Ser/Thr protein kinase)